MVSDVLDFLFKPNFGLNLDILKVEMGGDTDSTGSCCYSQLLLRFCVPAPCPAPAAAPCCSCC